MVCQLFKQTELASNFARNFALEERQTGSQHKRRKQVRENQKKMRAWSCWMKVANSSLGGSSSILARRRNIIFLVAAALLITLSGNLLFFAWQCKGGPGRIVCSVWKCVTSSLESEAALAFGSISIRWRACNRVGRLIYKEQINFCTDWGGWKFVRLTTSLQTVSNQC